MARSHFLPRADADRSIWLTHFATTLAAHAATVGVLPAEVTATTNDANNFRITLDAVALVKDKMNELVARKNLLRDGPLSTTAMTAFNPLVLPAILPLVAPGVFVRVCQLIARIKAHPAYTEAIGQDLGIIGPEDTFDPNSLKPVLTLKVLGGNVVVGWDKDKATAIELWVSRTGVAGPYAMLDLDTKPDYEDPTPLPANPANWAYKGMYRLGDERVGLWSDPCSISVGG